MKVTDVARKLQLDEIAQLVEVNGRLQGLRSRVIEVKSRDGKKSRKVQVDTVDRRKKL